MPIYVYQWWFFDFAFVDSNSLRVEATTEEDWNARNKLLWGNTRPPVYLTVGFVESLLQDRLESTFHGVPQDSFRQSKVEAIGFCGSKSI